MHVLLRVVSDLHVGSPLGLWPATGLKYRRDEPKVDLTPAQEFLYRQWKKLASFEYPDILVINGDIVSSDEGLPYDLISRAAIVLIRQLMSEKTKLYLVRGTPYHEKFYEAFVQGLNPQPNPEGGYIGDFIEFLINGKRINIAHHPEGSSGAIYKGTILGKASVWAAVAASSGKVKMPDVIVRSHLHFYARYQDDLCTVIHTPCFNLQTPYARKKAFYRLQPDIGAVDIQVYSTGEIDIVPHLFEVPDVERAVVWVGNKQSGR